jgi:hypothetical protein
MTTIAEKKGQVGFLFMFMVVVLGFAAFRGAENAPIIAGLMGLGAAGFLAMAVVWFRKPAPFLSISPEEIWYGRLDQAGTRIERTEGGRLAFAQGSNDSGWFLQLVDEPDQPGILMTGFDMNQVAAACTAHGWTFRG